MAPFADFLFFGVMLYIILPTILLGLWGKANDHWASIACIIALLVIFSGDLALRPKINIPYLEVVAGYAVYQLLIAWSFWRWQSRAFFYAAVGLALLPLGGVKFLPLLGDTTFGFIGISYVTFRALDVIFSIQDKVLKNFAAGQYLSFLFFFPTISAGPVDRYRRFSQDWNRVRGRHEFLDDLDTAMQRVFQGFLYKFITAALIEKYWLEPAGRTNGALAVVNYMYAYTFFLFFDFAGYSAFAIGFSRLFGVRAPENFDKPFLSRNIRDFWNRWHISLSFWFRDHVYMRFLLAAAKGKWFKGKHSASYCGLFLTFGLMGLWHGVERHYLLYGAYHAALLCGYDIFARWNKQTRRWPAGRLMQGLNIVITFHAIAFGLLIFSGRLSPKPVPRYDQVVDVADCHTITGWAWDIKQPDLPLHVDIYIDETPMGRVTANLLRPELRQQGYGNGLHGFSFPVPDYFHDGRAHVVEAKVSESGRSLRNTPETFSCPKP